VNLEGASQADLAALLAGGHPFDPAALAGRVYHGTSLGLPAWIERLTWKRFAKCFARDSRRGWNQRVVRGRLRRYGWFDVTTRDGTVVLDYGVLRDPLVSLRAGSADLLLGRSLLALGVATVSTPSYFVLERGEVIPS
jgi:hypothetical protein